MGMSNFADRTLLLSLAAVLLTGCARTVPLTAPPSPVAAPVVKPPGVTANSGGDTRGTVLYQPNSAPASPPDPYAAITRKYTLAQRQRMAWALAEIDLYAHRQAEAAFPVPDSSSPGYTKKSALHIAEHQAEFNAYLLEKYQAHFCNQFGVTYDQLALLIQEGRDQNWPMPPASGA